MDNWTGRYELIGQTKAFVKLRQVVDKSVVATAADLGYIYMRKSLWQQLGSGKLFVVGVTPL